MRTHIDTYDDECAMRRPSVSSFDPDDASTRTSRTRYVSRKAQGRTSSHSLTNENSMGTPEPSKSAFSRIVELSTVRDRSTCELRERLVEEGYDKVEVEQALLRAHECSIVDDMRFADAFVRGRVSAGKGELLIRRDLNKHGIDIDALEGWPEDYAMGFDEQVRRAYEHLCARPAPHVKDVYASARRRLESKGYAAGVCHAAAQRYKQGLEDL